MAHNYQESSSCSSGGGYVWLTNLNTDEAQILADNNILVSPVWHLPHRWHVSAGGYAVAPIPLEGMLLDDLIEQRWEALPPAQCDLPEWAQTRDIWLPILQCERELELGCYFGPYHGRYNVTGRWAYWRTRDVDTVLWEHGYHPEYRAETPACGWHSAPPNRSARLSSRSGSSDDSSAARSIPYEASPTRSCGVVIREFTAGSSPVHVKKEAAPARVKKKAPARVKTAAGEDRGRAGAGGGAALVGLGARDGQHGASPR
jgi:hypothetical protein